MTKLVAGWADFCAPDDGIGPFSDLFNKGINLFHKDSLKGIDAVLLWGGSDISPTLYAEEPIKSSGPKIPTSRDLFELEICKQAHQEGKPIIGVCRGAQFICAFAGGKLVQDVNNHSHGGHYIVTDKGVEFKVTSCHHQMMFPFDIQHEMLATTKGHRGTYYDGCPGAYMLKDRHYEEPEVVYFPEVNGFGVQCHPEWHESTHPFNKWIIEQIKEKCLGA